MSAYAPPEGFYSVAQVAAIRGTDRHAAWKWLSRNAGKHFRRNGGRRIISKERYRQLAMADYIEDKLAKVQVKLDRLDERLTEEIMRLEAGMRTSATTRQK